MASRYEKHYTLGNDARCIGQLLDELRANLDAFDDTMQVCMALSEALTNAMHHGNLEVDSDLREDNLYLDTIEERRHQPPYCDRKVHLSIRMAGSTVAFVVRDEGSGFDPGVVPDPRTPENLTRKSGRGLFLIREFADEVSFNECGNELTIVLLGS